MIRHLFKIIWNRRRRNGLMITGIFFSFIILFIVFTTLISSWGNFREPLGYKTENLWRLSINWHDSDLGEVRNTLEQMGNLMKGFGEIDSWTFSDSMLFSRSSLSFHFMHHDEVLVFVGFNTDDNFAGIMDLNIIDGRWYGEEDNGTGSVPIVITRRLKARYFPDTPIDKIRLYDDDDKYRVVGVVDVFRKEGKLSDPAELIFQRKPEADKQSLYFSSYSNLIIKTNGPQNMIFEEKLVKELSRQAPKWGLTLDSLDKIKADNIKENISGPLILLVVGLFFLFNIALGLFGVIWYNTGKRYPEIGLRRALGSTAAKIGSLIIGETLVLATFAVIIATVFAVQIPLLNIFGSVSTGTFILSWILAAVFIYFTAAVCALYPAWLAAKKEPATALHYE